ncbi:hypothetical protein [Rheinheimera sp.]
MTDGQDVRGTQPCFCDDQLRQFSARLNMAKAGKKVLRKLHKQQFDY